eukprot:m.25559 g.25559  ORF g.25559 m.25559 type:complete len:959 (+) comp7716_c0_seq1:242-3118(+)
MGTTLSPPPIVSLVPAPSCETCAGNSVDSANVFSVNCAACVGSLSRTVQSVSPSESFAMIVSCLRQWNDSQSKIDLFFNELRIRGVMLNSIDLVTGMSLIHFAAKSGAQEIGSDEKAAIVVQQLLRNGIDANTRCMYSGMTPLHYASFYGCPKVIKELAQVPTIDINAVLEDTKSSALHAAVNAGQVSAVRALLGAGVATSLRNSSGNTPLVCAESELSKRRNGIPDGLATEKELVEIIGLLKAAADNLPMGQWIDVDKKFMRGAVISIDRNGNGLANVDGIDVPMKCKPLGNGRFSIKDMSRNGPDNEFVMEDGRLVGGPARPGGAALGGRRGSSYAPLWILQSVADVRKEKDKLRQKIVEEENARLAALKKQAEDEAARRAKEQEEIERKRNDADEARKRLAKELADKAEEEKLRREREKEDAEKQKTGRGFVMPENATLHGGRVRGGGEEDDVDMEKATFVPAKPRTSVQRLKEEVLMKPADTPEGLRKDKDDLARLRQEQLDALRREREKLEELAAAQRAKELAEEEAARQAAEEDARLEEEEFERLRDAELAALERERNKIRSPEGESPDFYSTINTEDGNVEFPDWEELRRTAGTEDPYSQNMTGFDDILTSKEKGRKVSLTASTSTSARQEAEEDNLEPIEVGDLVLVSKKKKGVVRFKGETDFNPGTILYGIELEEPEGKHNGTIGLRTYFRCRGGYGTFSPRRKLTRLGRATDGEEQKAPRRRYSNPAPNRVTPKKTPRVAPFSTLAMSKTQSQTQAKPLQYFPNAHARVKSLKQDKPEEKSLWSPLRDSVKTTAVLKSISEDKPPPPKARRESNLSEAVRLKRARQSMQQKREEAEKKRISARKSQISPSARLSTSREFGHGSKVLIRRAGNSSMGLVRFIGKTHLGNGPYIGVELTGSSPSFGNEKLHKGTVDGHEYFKLKGNVGVLVPASIVTWHGLKVTGILGKT